jgi:acyl-CoA synthetase (AMP-forming)/AMP-acid ligase II
MTVIGEWITAAADRQGDAPYLEDAALEDAAVLADAALENAGDGGTLSYAGLRRSTQVWAQCLDRAGVPAGAGVAVRLADPLGYATALVAILAAGRVVIPLDPAAPAAEVARVLAVARPRAAVSDSGRGLPPGLAVLRPPEAPAAQDTVDTVEIPVGAGAAGGIFLCTSGTTGTPKGILLREDLLPAAVPRQRRGGRVAGDPRRPGLPGARR